MAKIWRYMPPSILQSIRCSSPVPFAEKHPHRMMFTPPCFTVGMVFLGPYTSFFFLQIWRVEFGPKSSIFLSSDHMAFSHSSSGSSRWSLANFRQAWTCAGVSSGTLRSLQDEYHPKHHPKREARGCKHHSVGMLLCKGDRTTAPY